MKTTTGTMWAASVMLLAQGCGGSTGRTLPSGEGGDEHVAVFVRADEDAPARRSRDDLMRDALAGTAEGTETHLASRRGLRAVRLPSVGPGANAKFEFDNGRRGWVTAMPDTQLITSPAYANGKVFLGGGFSSHQFYALDASTGEMKWAVAAPDGGPSAAIVQDDKVLFNTESCTLFVVAAESGELLWKRWLGDPLMSQPVASGDLVMSAYPANGAHVFGAFRLRDGEPVWTTDIPADVIQAPQVRGNDVYFATMDGAAFRVEVRTGRVVWRADVGAASPLWVSTDRALVTRRVDEGGVTYEEPVVLDARNGRVVRTGQRVRAAYLAGQSRDRQLASDQTGAWGSVPHGEHLGLRNVASGWAFQGASAAVVDGRAYFAIGGELRAREVATGRDVWTRSYAEAGDAQAMSPPAVVDGQVIFGTVEGHLYAVDIDTGITVWAYDVGEPIVFQPVVAQGWVYVATSRGKLVALELGDPGLDGWHMWGGNAQHAGLVETAGTIDPGTLAALARPSRGEMRVAKIEEAEGEHTQEATPAPSGGEDGVTHVGPPADQPREVTLPLERTDVRGEVTGYVARMHVTQVFRNATGKPIEALYLFPLPDEGAVDAMEMHIGERVVRARIQGRAEARQTYTEARASGRRAALLEAQRPGLFAQRVANIQPGERIEVVLTYVQPLAYEDGHYELVFPMVAPRRYDPSAAPGANARAASVRDELASESVTTVSAASSRADERSPVHLAVALDARLPLAEVTSPTHTSTGIARSGASRAQVTLDARTDADRDFVLRWQLAGELPAATWMAERDAHEGWFSVLVQPPAAPAAELDALRDVIVVVDTSSSMAGRPMAQAQGVVRALLGGLRSGERFQVLGFADQVVRSASAMTDVSDAAVHDAVAFTQRLRAVGTTTMVPALEEALDRAGARQDTARLPIVVLISDGNLGNERDVLRTIATHLGESRLYAVGVGGAPNRFLLDRAASVGRGRSKVLPLTADGATEGARLAAQLAHPVMTDVAIDFGGLDVEDVYPRAIPDLFASKPLLVRGRFVRGGRAQVKVFGTIAGQRVQQTLVLDLPTTPTPTTSAQRPMWARAAIADRLERMTLREDPELVREVRELGLHHAIVTPYTSFVAVDETPVAPRPQASPAAQGEGTSSNDATQTEAATLSPARSLPGDPEIRVPAPADARAVTFVLPFGESVAAVYEPRLAMWTGRFLIPRDAAEGQYPVYVLITHADGHDERFALWYTVDHEAPLVDVEVVGEARPGQPVVIRARQRITRADLGQLGEQLRRQTLTPERAEILSDARRVEVTLPNGDVLPLEETAPGAWQTRWLIPESIREDTVRLTVVVVDLAANVRTQRLDVELAR